VRIWGSVVVGGLVALGAVTGAASGAGATPSHPGGVVDTCPEVLAGAPTGGLQKSTTPLAGSVVRRGTVVDVTLRWDRARFAASNLHKALDCVTVDGRAADDLSVQQRDAANDGEFTTRLTVPGGLPDGVQLCDRGFVSGPGRAGGFIREKSNDVCFTVRGDVPGAAGPVPVATPEQAPAASVSPAVNAAAPSLPAADTTTTTGPAPLRPPSPGALVGGLASPNAADLGAGQAGRTQPGTGAAVAGDQLDRPVPTLPRTGNDVATSLLVGLAALVGGQLIRFAAGGRPAGAGNGDAGAC